MTATPQFPRGPRHDALGCHNVSIRLVGYAARSVWSLSKSSPRVIPTFSSIPSSRFRMSRTASSPLTGDVQACAEPWYDAVPERYLSVCGCPPKDESLGLRRQRTQSRVSRVPRLVRSLARHGSVNCETLAKTMARWPRGCTIDSCHARGTSSSAQRE